jgi:hypothetical protein
MSFFESNRSMFLKRTDQEYIWNEGEVSEQNGILHTEKYSLGFEVLRAVLINSSIFWDIKPCSLLKVYWRFGGTHNLYLHSRRVNQARNQHEESTKQFEPRKWMQNVPLKYWLTCKGLYGIIFQKREFFRNIVTYIDCLALPWCISVVFLYRMGDYNGHNLLIVMIRHIQSQTGEKKIESA